MATAVISDEHQTTKVLTPTRLFELTLEEVSKRYCFSLEDSSTFKRDIDDFPIKVSDPKSPKFAVSCSKKNLSYVQRHIIYVNMKKIMLVRRNLVEDLTHSLSRMIVNSQTIDSDDADDLLEDTAAYIKYYGWITGTIKLGISLKTEDNLQILLSQIMRERLLQKQRYSFLIKRILSRSPVLRSARHGGSGDAFDCKICRNAGHNVGTQKGKCEVRANVREKTEARVKDSNEASVCEDDNIDDAVSLNGMVCAAGK